MKKVLKYIGWMALLLLPSSLFAWQWTDLWRTPDQQGAQLLQTGKATQASQVFKDKAWQGVAFYRAEDYKQAFQRFKSQKTSDGQYNAGNAAAYLGRYQEAIDAYDKAIALNPHNADAVTNRELVKKLMNDKKQQSNCSCSKNSSSESAKNEKKDTDKNEENKSTNNQSSAQQKQAQNNSQSSGQRNQSQNNSQQNHQTQQDDKHTESKSSQNNQQQDTGQDNRPQTKASHSPANDNGQLKDHKESESKQEQANASASSQWQAQGDDQKQLLRRIPDDPGGLLRQKFLRDYYRRHANEMDEGGI